MKIDRLISITLLTDFQFFIRTLCGQFAIMWLLNISHYTVNASLNYLV